MSLKFLNASIVSSAIYGGEDAFEFFLRNQKFRGGVECDRYPTNKMTDSWPGHLVFQLENLSKSMQGGVDPTKLIVVALHPQEMVGKTKYL